MEPNSIETVSTEQRLTIIEQKIDILVKEAKASAMSRKITIVLTVVFFVLPLIAIVALLPTIMNSLTTAYSITDAAI